MNPVEAELAREGQKVFDKGLNTGSVWKRLKSGNEYRIVGTGILEANEDYAVIYTRNDKAGPHWIRPLRDFYDRFQHLSSPSADSTGQNESSDYLDELRGKMDTPFAIKLLTYLDRSVHDAEEIFSDSTETLLSRQWISARLNRMERELSTMPQRQTQGSEVNHVCGSQGFQRGPTEALDDKCPACEANK